jgi:hypothetical protein
VVVRGVAIVAAKAVEGRVRAEGAMVRVAVARASAPKAAGGKVKVAAVMAEEKVVDAMVVGGRAGVMAVATVAEAMVVGK